MYVYTNRHNSYRSYQRTRDNLRTRKLYPAPAPLAYCKHGKLLKKHIWTLQKPLRTPRTAKPFLTPNSSNCSGAKSGLGGLCRSVSALNKATTQFIEQKTMKRKFRILASARYVPGGHGVHSLVLCTLVPWQGSPPLLGGGLVQVRVLFCPFARVSPGQRQSIHADHWDQPPFTAMIQITFVNVFTFFVWSSGFIAWIPRRDGIYHAGRWKLRFRYQRLVSYCFLFNASLEIRKCTNFSLVFDK